MSRIGKKPIIIPSNVEISNINNIITIKGPLGEQHLFIRPEIKINFNSPLLELQCIQETKELKSYHGLVRALVANIVSGVCKPYIKILILEGVGYKFNLSATQLSLNIGYTHIISFTIPDTLSLKLESATKLAISGINKEQVGYFAAKIRILRIPEPYKGKGILYENEKIRRKVGKTGNK